ncbi:unnamed protein product [Pieris macdunnoughi]|nr:unnamed protein product [Pieris macdunnoughi]
MTAFEELVSEIMLVRDEFSGLKSSVVEASTIVKDFGLRLQNIEDRLLDVEKTKELINNLQSRVDVLECEKDAAEQWNIMNNVELKGVPQTANENLLDLIISIGSKVNYAVTKQQLNFIARTPSRDSNHPKPIVACINSRYVKENFVAAVRLFYRDSSLSANLLGLKGSAKIFANDHLTSRNKILLNKTKHLAKEMDWRYVWVKHCKIQVRRGDSSPVLTIKPDKDLLKITKGGM